MITRIDFILKLQKWLTVGTCEKLANFVERELDGNYWQMLDYMADYTDDFRGLRNYLHYATGVNYEFCEHDNAGIEQMATDMIYEW